jgi:DNA invertase Pin-like site-specific DNA recombinase
MRVAFYARVSTDRQQQAQTIEQQVTQLHRYVTARQGEEWTVAAEHVFRDDGHSGAKLDCPGLDALRDQAARAAFDLVLVTAPDRLARNFVHQMVVLEELQRRGGRVVFCDRPLTDDPHEQLVTQIRGAVAEYERTLIADRMRRGRLARLRSGHLLPRAGAAHPGGAGGRAGPGPGRQPAGPRLPWHGQAQGALPCAARRPLYQRPAHSGAAGLQPRAGRAAGAGGAGDRHLGNAWVLRRWRGLLYRVREVFRAAGVLICLGRWLHRVRA